MSARMGVVLAGVVGAFGLAAALAPRAVRSGGAPDQERRIVATNLVVPAGETVVSPAISLDGFATFATQVTIRSGLAADFTWRAVFRMRDDLDWVGEAGFGTSFIKTDRVRSPFTAIEFRNLGGEEVRVALSAFLDRRNNFEDGRRVVATRVVVEEPITIPSGQFRFGGAIDMTGASRYCSQLSFPNGRGFPPGTVSSSYEGKICGPQSFASAVGSNGPTDRSLGELFSAFIPTERVKITNGSGQSLDVVAAHYVLTLE